MYLAKLSFLCFYRNEQDETIIKIEIKSRYQILLFRFNAKYRILRLPVNCQNRQFVVQFGSRLT